MMGNYQETICSILIFWTVITMNSCQKLPWGSPCKTDLQCNGSDDDLIFTFISNLKCVDSRCKCNSVSHSPKFKDNNYVCTSKLHYGNVYTCKLDDPDTCLNGVCKDDLLNSRCECNDGYVDIGGKCRETVTVEFSANCTTPDSGPVPVCKYDDLMRCNSTGKCACFKDHFYDVENKTCISNESYVEKYPEETRADLDEFCGISSDGLPKVCNETANMKCVLKKCKCTKEFYPRFSNNSGENNTCESKASYVKENNLTSYKVMPGLYCYNTDDCITGLTCASNECDCPYPCTYDNNTIACDCGAVSSMEGASQAVLVGVIGGIVIIVFWGHMIKKTLDNKTIHKPHPESTEHHAYVNSVPLSEPYRIKTSTNDYSTSTTATNPPYPVSPVSNQEPIPVPSYPVSEPSDPSAPVGFSAPISTPDATQQLPPYTSNPSQYSTSPPPYNSNPTPYATSPATSPATDPGNSISSVMNTGSEYPVCPGADQTTENSTNPTANATPYPLNSPSAPAVDIYKPIIS